MIGIIVLILLVMVVLYFLSVNNKINSPWLTDSSPSITDSSDSVQVDQQTGQYTMKLNNPQIKSLRVTYESNGGTKISKVFIAERALTFNEIVDEANRSVGNNCVFLGTLSDSIVASTSSSSSSNNTTSVTRTTANFDVKQFKNIFVIFKNLDATKTKETSVMARYESEGMSYFLIDSGAAAVPEIRDVSYPVTVYTTNAAVQQKLVEWNYIQVNENGTLFIKNHRSFRIQ
ncbi:Occlusion-derived virus envelope protein-25 [Trabala vishnou gigantina nucleopolyhedrovirus]|uniref:Occlusion-derived virus envelope protein-25 n=1 Tax=Trabala vishnou gigantina nucleopolyhedrovirus TaxID=2863583 RepID=UPI002481A819|nr:Occlusion-derived virus envelope protein-25 [Trabala vishnou gigantina nucleopolyhedrovirus]QYC92729.1 Occlusion-derived virus envelope protein-25 [Trabala vishnou gigantina nucleopolyhedrovirus]